MSDSYQAIYDAVSSRIGRPDIAGTIDRVAREAFDIGWQKQHAQEAIYMVANEHVRPFVLLKPSLQPDGNMWCALYGDDLQTGVAGFGETPAQAAANFDIAWLNERTPASAIEARRAAAAKTDAVHESAVGNAETPNTNTRGGTP